MTCKAISLSAAVKFQLSGTMGYHGNVSVIDQVFVRRFCWRQIKCTKESNRNIASSDRLGSRGTMEPHNEFRRRKRLQTRENSRCDEEYNNLLGLTPLLSFGENPCRRLWPCACRANFPGCMVRRNATRLRKTILVHFVLLRGVQKIHSAEKSAATKRALTQLLHYSMSKGRDVRVSNFSYYKLTAAPANMSWLEIYLALP